MKFTRKIGFLPLIALVSVTMQSCSDDLLDVDITNSKYNLKTIHLDSIIKHTKTENLSSEVTELSQKIPEIIDYQFYYCYKTVLPKSPFIFKGPFVICLVVSEQDMLFLFG